MKYINMKVKGVIIDPSTFVPMIMLKDYEEKRVLTLDVGILEVAYILMRLDGIKPDRPVTHDIIDRIITDLGSKVLSVAITALKDNVFYASIKLSSNSGEIIEIDSRPSDAIALAMRFDVPIKVRESVIEKSRVIDITSGNLKGIKENELMNILENLPMENFGKYKM